MHLRYGSQIAPHDSPGLQGDRAERYMPSCSLPLAIWDHSPQALDRLPPEPPASPHGSPDSRRAAQWSLEAFAARRRGLRAATAPGVERESHGRRNSSTSSAHGDPPPSPRRWWPAHGILRLAPTPDFGLGSLNQPTTTPRAKSFSAGGAAARQQLQRRISVAVIEASVSLASRAPSHSPPDDPPTPLRRESAAVVGWLGLRSSLSGCDKAAGGALFRSAVTDTDEYSSRSVTSSRPSIKSQRSGLVQAWPAAPYTPCQLAEFSDQLKARFLPPSLCVGFLLRSSEHVVCCCNRRMCLAHTISPSFFLAPCSHGRYCSQADAASLRAALTATDERLPRAPPTSSPAGGALLLPAGSSSSSSCSSQHDHSDCLRGLALAGSSRAVAGAHSSPPAQGLDSCDGGGCRLLRTLQLASARNASRLREMCDSKEMARCAMLNPKP